MMQPMAFLTGSPADWIIIMVVALVVFGPNKLPEVGKQLGQAMREFNKLKDELTGAAHSIRSEVESVYEPIVQPYSTAHNTSSHTVDAVSIGKVYDQEPHDLMAPAVPEVHPLDNASHASLDGKLLSSPPPSLQEAPEVQDMKGHGI